MADKYNPQSLKEDAIIKSIVGIEEISKISGVYIGQWKGVGDEVHQYTSMATISFSNESIDDVCAMIDQINRTVKFLNDKGDDIIIKYTEFDYLKQMYQNGLEGK